MTQFWKKPGKTLRKIGRKADKKAIQPLIKPVKKPIKKVVAAGEKRGTTANPSYNTLTGFKTNISVSYGK